MSSLVVLNRPAPDSGAGLFKTTVEHTPAELFDAATQDRSSTDMTIVWGLTAAQSDHSANQVLSKPKLLSQRNRGESIGYTCELCCARTAWGRIPWKAPGLWQNSTAVKRSIQILQQSSELQEALHKKQQRPAAWTASPLTEGEAVQSVHLCFQSNNLQWLTQH